MREEQEQRIKEDTVSPPDRRRQEKTGEDKKKTWRRRRQEDDDERHERWLFTKRTEQHTIRVETKKNTWIIIDLFSIMKCSLKKWTQEKRYISSLFLLSFQRMSLLRLWRVAFQGLIDYHCMSSHSAWILFIFLLHSKKAEEKSSLRPHVLLRLDNQVVRCSPWSLDIWNWEIEMSVKEVVSTSCWSCSLLLVCWRMKVELMLFFAGSQRQPDLFLLWILQREPSRCKPPVLTSLPSCY